MAERTLKRIAFVLDCCIFCGDCVEVCPHGALGETPNFELSFFNCFGLDITLEKVILRLLQITWYVNACRVVEKDVPERVRLCVVYYQREVSVSNAFNVNVEEASIPRCAASFTFWLTLKEFSLSLFAS